MSLIINTNISALNTQRQLARNTSNVNSMIEKLSSGFRINRASDDAAGLNISETMRTQIRGMAQALNNTQDGINMLEVAEGGLSVITENLQRIRELTVQAANDTNATAERQAIAREVNERVLDITRIARTLKFNKIELLSGNSDEASLQIGANSTAATNVLTVGAVLDIATAGVNGLNITGVAFTAAAAGRFNSGGTCRTFLGVIDTALNTVFTRRSQIGAYQNRLQSTVESLSIAKQNITASESRIRDLDVAAASSELTKSQVLQQAAASMLVQANTTPQLALTLLR